MTDTPEKIWAATGLYYEYLDDWSEGEWWAEKEDACSGSSSDERVVEYTRSDIAQAMVAAAYDMGYSDVISDDPANYHPSTDARAALDAMLAKAREDALREAANRNALTVRSIKEAIDLRDYDAAREIAMKGNAALLALIDRTADRKP